jgi:hypothetical protein
VATGTDAQAEYTRRLDRHRAEEARLKKRHQTIANARLVIVLLGLILAWLAFTSPLISPVWLLLPLVAFVALVLQHERVTRDLRRAGRAAGYYERGLARLDGRWAGAGEPGLRFRNEAHPYADDLDLFGQGSLFERLCTARTRSGEETLATWLLHPADPEEILARQAAVSELRLALDLREDLALMGEDVRAGLDPAALAAWGQAPRTHFSRGVRAGALLLAALAMLALVGWGFFQTGSLPLVAMILSELVFAFWLRPRVARVLAAVDRRANDLALLSELLARIESERFSAPRLLRLRAALDVEGLPPSRQVARLSRLLRRLDAKRNQIFTPFAALMLWTTRCAFAIEDWRAKSGPSIAAWIAAVGELEALCALASYAYENAADPFPEIVPEGPLFHGQALGHPLLPDAHCVRNDVSLDATRQVLVVSGSNMSGKSTLLRTVGTNAVLAQAGAPVRAARLRLSPLAVGATLRVQDSLQAGRSRFFAEITRLRLLVDLASGPLPLLFLLDEVLHGTNSHDRRIGAEAVVRGLIDRGAIGLVTTHDLALAEIADRLAPRAANVHFEDQFVHGAMTFDYRMRDGVVTHSNALALMQSVGLLS